MTIYDNLIAIKEEIKNIKNKLNLEFGKIIEDNEILENYPSSINKIKTITDTRDLYKYRTDIESINNINALLSITEPVNFNSAFQNIKNLEYMHDRPDVLVGDAYSMFYGLESYKLPVFNWSIVSSISRLVMFSNYNITNFESLLSINNNHIPYNCNQAFYSARYIENIPSDIIIRPSDASRMFYNCTKLSVGPTIDSSRCTSFYQMYYNCQNIRKIHLDVSSNKSDSGLVFPNINDTELNDVIITANNTPEEFFRDGIYLGYCKLDKNAIIRLFDNLFVANPEWDTNKRKITLTQNPGVTQLTDEDKIIATSKNWILVL